jgi:SanA protein
MITFQLNYSGMVKLLKCKKGLITAGMLINLFFCMPFAASIFIWNSTDDLIYKNISDAPKMESVLVLGAAAYPSRLSDVLQDRVDTAIDIYKAEKASKIIMSGAPNEAEGMAKYAVKKGVPEGDIIQDTKGLDTMSSVINAKKAGSLIIVSQRYHLPRALFIAKHYGMDAIGVPADRHEYTKIFDFKKRELLASSAAMAELFLTK